MLFLYFSRFFVDVFLVCLQETSQPFFSQQRQKNNKKHHSKKKQKKQKKHRMKRSLSACGPGATNLLDDRKRSQQKLIARGEDVCSPHITMQSLMQSAGRSLPFSP
jgi:hypothetical protein